MDTKKLCKCCFLRPPVKYLNTPYTNIGKTEIYSDLIKECFQIRPTQNDKDDGICAKCICRLKDAQDFKLQVQHSLTLEQQDTVEELSVKSETSTVEEFPSHEESYELVEDPLGSPSMLEDDKKDNTLCKDPTFESSIPAPTSRGRVMATTRVFIKTQKSEGEAPARSKKVRPTAPRVKKVKKANQKRKAKAVENTADPAAEKPAPEDELFGAEDLLILVIKEEDEPQPLEILEGAATDTGINLTALDNNVSDLPYKCIKCDETIDNSNTVHKCIDSVEDWNTVDNAADDHTAKESLICEACGMLFTEKSCFNNHVQSHEDSNEVQLDKNSKPEEDIKLYCCDICKNNFSEKGLLIDHLETHNSEKLHPCTICHEMISKLDLYTHMRACHGIQVYSCDICHKKFTKRTSLIVHKRIHAGQTKFHPCTVCGQRFTKKADLITHKLVHEATKRYECELCPKRYSAQSNLNEHLLWHAGHKPYECNICKKTFRSRSNLNSHVRIHTEEKSYECKVCLQRFRFSSNLVKHIRVHHKEVGPLYNCDICDEKFEFQPQLIAHKHTHTNRSLTSEKPYQCKLCQRQFTQKGHLTEHLRLHTGHKPYECDICKKRCNSKSNLNSHRKTHTGEKRYECHVCQKRFTTRKCLPNHMLVYHPEVCDQSLLTQDMYVCDFCSKKFKHKSKLGVHIKTHTEKIKVCCETCGALVKKSSLGMHRLRHKRGENCHICHICNEEFVQASYLRKHMFTHDRQFSCGICDKRFVLEDSFNKHLKSHDRAVTHFCDICCRGFLYLSQLNRHKTIHSNARPHACTMCDKAFKTHVRLNEHVKWKH